MPSTSARLLALLSLLQTRRDWSMGALADRLDVSTRTVRRDVDRLRDLGYPVTSTRGRDGGYRLDAGTELPPLLLDDDQAVAVAVGLRAAAAAGAGVEEAAVRALATLRQVLPARLRHRVDAVEFRALRAEDAPEVDPAVLVALSTAVRAREVLRFDYAAPGRDLPAGAPPVPPRRAEPHHLVARAGRWYLVAWDLDRSAWRTFRADRLTPRVPTGPRFAPRDLPGGDVGDVVAGRFRGAGPGDGTAWPCRGEVLLDLPLDRVAPFAPDGLATAAGPDRTRLVLGSWSWPALAAAVGRFDADVEVVGPPELRAACAALAARYARAAAPAPSG